jgi:hypothetical protein
LGDDGDFFSVNETAIKMVSDDSRFMSEERFAKSSGSLPETRGFLYNCLGLNPLFDGDGYTKMEDGSRGVLEFLMPNVRVADIPHHRYVDIPVTLADLDLS